MGLWLSQFDPRHSERGGGREGMFGVWELESWTGEIRPDVMDMMIEDLEYTA